MLQRIQSFWVGCVVHDLEILQINIQFDAITLDSHVNVSLMHVQSKQRIRIIERMDEHWL